MTHAAVVTFTARNFLQILADQGSQAWRLDMERARRSEYLVCTQNARNGAMATPTAQHGHAFLIGRISDVVPAPERPDRWLIRISEYVACDVPNVWGKLGHLRYPVWYTTLEDVGIDLDRLPPFKPLLGSDDVEGFAEAVTPLYDFAMRETPITRRRPSDAGGGPTLAGQAIADHDDPWERLDAILAQFDRVPDLVTPQAPLVWDDHGLPR